MLFKIAVAIIRFLLSLRYNIRVEGLDKINKISKNSYPVLFLPNHTALIDPVIIYSLIYQFRPRTLADERQIDQPFVRTVAKILRTITIPDLSSISSDHRRSAVYVVKQALNNCADALLGGDSVLFYPSGRITHDGHERIGSNSGVHRILSKVGIKGIRCRVVLIRVNGLFGSSFSYYKGKVNFLNVLKHGFLRLLANGIFFMPKRDVDVYFEEITDMNALTSMDNKELNKFLEEWYDMIPQRIQTTPNLYPAH